MKKLIMILAFVIAFSSPVSADDDDKQKLEILKCLPDGQISRITYMNFATLNDMADKQFNGLQVPAKDSPFFAPLSPAFAEHVEWKVSARYKGGIRVYIYKIETFRDLMKDAKERKYLNEVNIYYKNRELLFVGDPEDYLATDTLPEKYLLALPFDEEHLFLCNNFNFFGQLIDAAREKTPLAMDNPYYASIFNQDWYDAKMETPCFKVIYGYAPKAKARTYFDERIRQHSDNQENYKSLTAKGRIYHLEIPFGVYDGGSPGHYDLIVLFFGQKGLSPVNASHDHYSLQILMGSAASEEYLLEKFTKHKKGK